MSATISVLSLYLEQEVRNDAEKGPQLAAGTGVVTRSEFVARAGDRRLFTGAASLARIFLLPKATLGKRNAVQEEKLRVSDIADLVLVRQARVRAERTDEPSLEALEAVVETEAGQQLEGLRDGPYCDEEAKRWQDELAPRRAKKRIKARQEEEHSLAQRDAACEQFMQAALRNEGLLARRRSHSGRLTD
jgi:hypothetical protein